MYNFASESVTYKVYDDWRSATNVLSTKEGDCTDKSILLVSLLQSSGIESYVLYSEKNAEDYSHAWVAAKVSGYWLQIDPTTADIFSVYGCLNKEECKEKSYYNNVAGIFNGEKSFEC